jgi:uncharacterized protein HemX
MYRISAPSMNPDSAARNPPAVVRLVLGLLVLVALGLLTYYVQVLQQQVERGQQFRAQLQHSGTTLAGANRPRGTGQLLASRR